MNIGATTNDEDKFQAAADYLQRLVDKAPVIAKAGLDNIKAWQNH